MKRRNSKYFNVKAIGIYYNHSALQDVVTVQTCYSSPWTPWFSLFISEGWLVYWRDWFIGILWLVFLIWTQNNCLVLFTSSVDDRKGTGPPREASLQFSGDMNFVLLTCITVIKCLRKCVAGPQTNENNRLHIWGSEFYTLGTVLFSKVMWLAHADCMMNLAS
jgi:hypothetical protein